jgi:hypothetical protein
MIMIKLLKWIPYIYRMNLVDHKNINIIHLVVNSIAHIIIMAH